MKKKIIIALLIVAVFSLSAVVRIKDIAKFRGARDNQLFGIGIVVGLNGTGDGGTLNSPLLANMFKNFGIPISEEDIKSNNTALVMVVADIPPFYKEGMRLDVIVASLGSAKSLENGVLLQTPLYGADGNIYAVAQGPVSVGGAEVKSSVNLQSRFKVTGYIPNGALIEKEIPANIVSDNSVTILLQNPDITTSARVATAINEKFSVKLAKAVDPASVRVQIPDAFSDDIITFLSIIEELEVIPDQAAKVVINERTGTVIFGGDIKISDFTLSYGNFVVSIKNGEIDGQEATISNLISALKALGATPQDIIGIIEELHKAGAIYAEIKVM
ncbi:flagellar basal body P-ring protein [Thermosipho africanus H17ap60334]|jgi:flagellar P-ring protein precursor FlgI|uniref:Flagellar P-ring protein n=1 Tax=Thermosipho africanus (strain TCF52B) TaxID=484019 RepID=B7IH03_THEAB|nr:MULTISPECIES: flagellar basal body P-ring protein FlgI [Thermosipho]HCF37550.1 flagellar basal body P-ring protein FlgI [Thermosipho africanus]ACJ75367.1 flagellar P-ring protein FlgI [Thermosipho africanus TCF52B]EKF50142.1 flagellar basal body P-ring protein [Thermosipho africanus H17ap60334]MBZ4651033.1 flgI [Thermosipho sp. (in: thermotogales)]MDK2840041.1 flagellar P-ring protein FlgI [Thermosipho sp. (in: thermotogales)]